MRAVVSGAAGFIGYHLCDRLLNDGLEVIGIDDLSTGQQMNVDALSPRPGFTFIRHDICKPVTVEGPVDWIYNMACPASPADFETKAIEIMHVCSQGTERMLELARSKKAGFLQASTSECYGEPLEHPQKETYWGNVNPIGLRAPYDEGKRYAEALVMTYHRQFGLNTHLVRIFNTYGPRMRAGDGRVLPNLINQALDNEPLTVYGDGSQTRSFCYCTDLVDGIVRLMGSDFHEPVNIGNEQEITVLEMAQLVINLIGSNSTVANKPLPKDDPTRRRPDLTRAKSLLNWQPKVSIDVGLPRTIDYFKQVKSGLIKD